MVVYTYSEARQKLASLLDQVLQEGEVRIKRRDGQVFVVKAEAEEGTITRNTLRGVVGF